MACEILFYRDGQPDAWDKVSAQGPNHESSLTLDEMKVLVMRILDIPGMKAPPADMPESIKLLATTLASDTGKVIVKKGIHQRDTDVHFTVNIYPEAGGAYHVWLKAGEEAETVTGTNTAGKAMKVKLFRYRPTGITHRVGPVDLKWPAAFVYSAGNMGLGRPRGQSISIGNVAAVAATSAPEKPSWAQMGMMTNPMPPTWKPPTV
ncbi:MAG: hypothetical protein K2X74_03700 [Acetobacteraceae bacterium]|nr:hypothetical protein [Acetobacteraceae bacterium]